jgi:hypothetical protein
MNYKQSKTHANGTFHLDLFLFFSYIDDNEKHLSRDLWAPKAHQMVWALRARRN